MGSKKEKVGVWQSLCLYVANHIPIQSRKRSRVGQLVVVLHYLVDYLILWTIIQLNYNPKVTLNFDWPFVIARTLAVVLFILSKQPLFFLLGKIVLLMQFVLTASSLPFLDVLVGVAEVGMAGVWALTKEQRMLHFDSRFEISGAFLKQTIFYVTVTVQLMLPNGSGQYEGQFALLGCVVVMALVDFSEVYYSRLTKGMFLRLDAILLLLTAATIYQDVLALGFLEFVFASLFLFAVATLHLIFAPTSRSHLFSLNSQELSSLPEEVLMEAVIELKRIAQGSDAEAVETYLFKMREEAEDAQLVEKVTESQEKDAACRQELLSNFIFQTLKRGAKSSKRLRDLVIYLYSPSPRLYCFLDLKDWQHLREYRRIIAQELNDSTLREAEAEKELEVVKELVQRYTRVSGILLQELMKERIREGKVEHYGDQLIELLEQLQRISVEEKTKSNDVRDLINRFALDCLPPKYRTAIVRGEQGEGGVVREDLGEVVVGGEEDNYLTVLEANNCFNKLVYTRKEKYIGRPLALLLPPAVLAHLNRHIKTIAQKPEENAEFKPGFFFNTLGFAVACGWKVEPTTHRTGRAWKLSLRQEYCERAMLMVSESGQLQGFSELARYFGLAASERGKRVQGDAVGEIKTNAVHYLSTGENLFQDHEFYMPKGAILSVLDELLLEGRRFWVLEIKETDMKLKSLANPLVRTSSIEPPPFEFHFDWANTRITTEPVEQHIRVKCNQEEQRQAVNYGENITEMRYFKERIDYKSNFEEERDCPSLQPHTQRALSSLSVNEFHEKWDRKKNSAPLWFKVSVGIIVLLAVVGVGSAVFYLLLFNGAVSAGSTSLQVSTKLQEKLQSVVLLGELTTLPLINSSVNASQAITAQIAATNALSSQLYSLDQNIFNNNGGQGILNLLNALNLHINSYLLTPNYPYRNALALLTTQIVPSFNAFISTTVASYANTSSGSSRAAALICLSVACFGLFVVLWIISLRQSMRRQEVAEILKFVDNDDLQAMRERILRFKETWLDNVDCKQPEEEAEDEPDKENPSPPKHLIASFRMRRRKLFHALWLGGFVVLLILINRQTSAFTDLATNYVAFENNLATQVTGMQAVWAELNQAAPNVTLIKGLISVAQASEYGKNVILKSMAGSGQVDADFIGNYADFWESQGFCRYISDAKCSSIIGGAMSEGANMAICYLNIQHDSYIGTINSSPSFNLYEQATQPNVALLSLYYLPTITQTSNQFILAEFDTMSGIYSLATQYYFIGLVLHSLLVLVLLRWTIKERKTNSRIEELLMIMPFEKLKNFSAFHKYYLKYYATF